MEKKAKNAPAAEPAAPAAPAAAAPAAAAPKTPPAPTLESKLLAVLSKSAKAYTSKELTAMVLAGSPGGSGRNFPSVVSGALHKLCRRSKVVADGGRFRLK